ncbi:MAG: pyrroline-5-carboxylate reductase [Phycisphaerae bacterium]
MVRSLAFLGAGNMAEAIARGVLAAGALPAEVMVAADPNAERRRVFEGLGVTTYASATEAAVQAEVWLLAVKPQVMAGLLAELASVAGEGRRVISIAAGVTAAFIERQLPGARVVRSMPNTPMLLGAGVVAVSGGAAATAADVAFAARLFEPAAEVVSLPEAKMDAVTAISGSGPAYVFWLAEQMVAAGLAEGLSPEEARTLALTTVSGAGRMLAEADADPAELRKRVTSPGGTTQAALTRLDEAGVGPLVVEAIRAAAARSRELGA